MTDRCEPPPEHRGKRWHWVQYRDQEPEPAIWLWPDGPWIIDGDSDYPEGMAADGYRYLAPIPDPPQEPADD